MIKRQQWKKIKEFREGVRRGSLEGTGDKVNTEPKVG